MTTPINSVSAEPCQFCQSDDVGAISSPDEVRNKWVSWVECFDCSARGPMVDGDDEAEAIAAWNRRAANITAGPVERFYPAWPIGQMNTDPRGEWVRYSDYAASTTQLSQVGVKPLEWEKGFGRWDAQSVLGRYSILPNKGLPKPFEVLAPHGYLQMADDIDAAMAAAQSDFDQRIRSALASPPSPAEVTTRDAIYILEWIAAPRPPTHPAEMNGVQSFPSMEAAVRFFARSPDDTQFVSISERATVSSDKSDEFRALLEALQLNKKG